MTMLLLLLANLGVWALSGLLDPPVLARTAVTALDDPTVRQFVARHIGAGVAAAILERGPVPAALRRELEVAPLAAEAELGDALRRRVDRLLTDEGSRDTLMLVAVALAQLVRDVVDGTGDVGADATRDGLVVDLTPIGRLVLDGLDREDHLGDTLEPGSVTVRLLDGEVVGALVVLVRLLDALRSLLPIACAAAIATTIILARYRVHALAWIGLGAVVAGTVSLLLASGGPVLVPRSTDLPTDQAAAVTAALATVTAGLVTQSAVLAALGLALVVAGIAGGVVVSHGSAPRGDLHHGWDPGRLS
jgi:hypothetical protein